MAERIIGFFAKSIADPYLLAAVMSVLPVTEIKGCILYAATSGANVCLAALCAFLSSVGLAALQAVLFPKLLRAVKKRPLIRKVGFLFADRIAKKADEIVKRSKDANDRAERLFLGVFTFVALPFPLTGIWAGAILSALLGLDAKRTFFALVAGNFTAGGIVLAVALVAGKRAGLVLDLFFLTAILLFLLSVLHKLIAKSRKHKGCSKRIKTKEKALKHKF